MKKLLITIALIAAVCMLCGCAGVFDKEYVVVSDYVPPVQDSTAQGDKITVRNLNELKTALLGLISAGDSEGAILFDAAYDGDVVTDLASACWQVRTQDALCAYCVDNIAYDLSKMVTHYEAEISVSYSAAAPDAADIRQLQYSAGLEDIIRDTLEEGSDRLVVLIARSVYGAEEMESLVARVYRTYPDSAPKEPQVSVNMFSGTGRQRLYEIRFDYGLSAAEMENRRLQLLALEPFVSLEDEELDAAHRALLACEYLTEGCALSPDDASNDVYAALVEGEANSEGMALAYVALCRRLSVPCQIVYGQYNRVAHCWNIVELDGEYYHVDPAACAAYGMEYGFLMRDENAWNYYRWDTASYPACMGQLQYRDLLIHEEEPAPEDGSDEDFEEGSDGDGIAHASGEEIENGS
ncbi:MAG: hypothetical protein IJ594_02800 [Oscillospiraceae bacterium]|nr:hypothetical protein [Oscillospiraceae bacterium]